MMTKRFKVADHVTWNSEVGHVSDTIIKVHTKEVDYNGHTHHAEPGYRSTACDRADLAKERFNRPPKTNCRMDGIGIFRFPAGEKNTRVAAGKVTNVVAPRLPPALIGGSADFDASSIPPFQD
jgi:hypothetical protein